MNVLPKEKQVAVLTVLGEGGSIRGVERATGAHRDTIMRLLLRAGHACQALHDARVQGLRPARVQCDEAHAFVYARDRNLNGHARTGDRGTQFVWVAMDADTKLALCYRVGKRDAENAFALMRDLRARCRGHFQLTTDGLPAYIEAVRDTFGLDGLDFAQLVKIPGPSSKRRRSADWYEPAPDVVTTIPTPVFGVPNPAHISTSFVERQNLTLRHQVRRLTRLTPAFSKKLENLRAAVALHFARYNFVLVNRTLGTTPAVAAGLAGQPWTMDMLLGAAFQAQAATNGGLSTN